MGAARGVFHKEAVIMAGEFANRLAQMSEQWTSGKDKIDGVPDGIYNAQLQEAKLAESSSGKLMVKRQHLISDGEYAGEVVYDNIVVESEYGPKQLATWLTQLGYEAPADVTEIEDLVNAISLAAPSVQIQVKKSKNSDFRNVYIKQLLASEAPSPAAKAKPAAPAAKPVVKAKPKAALAFEIGTKVAFKDSDGNDAEGVVKGAGDAEGDIRVEADDGTLYDLPAGDLSAAVEAEETSAEDETRAGLLAICVAHGIEVTDEDDVETVKEKVTGQEWNKTELAEDEVALLESVGAVFAQAKPKVAAKPAAPKKPAPAPVKAKTAPAKAKKK